MKLNLLLGKGKNVAANGNVYEGNYEKGMPSGFGIMSMNSGFKYNGEFKDGVFHGR